MGALPAARSPCAQPSPIAPCSRTCRPPAQRAFAGAAHGSAARQPQPLRAAPDGPIDAIFTDVDGTLLDSQQRLSERTLRAVNAAVDAGVQVMLATGKARGPWLADIAGLRLQGPGVFLQGLYICDAQGRLMYSRELELDVATKVLDIAAREAVTCIVYSGERILCAAHDAHSERLVWYREPQPEAVGPLHSQLGQAPFNKMILFDTDERMRAIRPAVEAALEGVATLTTALPGALEILPLGASKGAGVARVCGDLSLPPARVMAVGDAENDLAMLQLAGFGVAMGNAGAAVKAAAAAVTASNDEDGLALAIERYVLAPRGVLAGA